MAEVPEGVRCLHQPEAHSANVWQSKSSAGIGKLTFSCLFVQDQSWSLHRMSWYVSVLFLMLPRTCQSKWSPEMYRPYNSLLDQIGLPGVPKDCSGWQMCKNSGHGRVQPSTLKLQKAVWESVLSECRVCLLYAPISPWINHLGGDAPATIYSRSACKNTHLEHEFHWLYHIWTRYDFTIGYIVLKGFLVSVASCDPNTGRCGVLTAKGNLVVSSYLFSGQFLIPVSAFLLLALLLCLHIEFLAFL